MATSSSLQHSTLAFLSPKPHNTTTTSKSYTPIRCGVRGKRGPLVKGRILSIEAIQAVQSLKRSPNPTDEIISNTLSRLIKADLVATLNELLRQDRCDLALKVFSTVRSEYTVDVSQYADLVLGMCKKMMWEDVDRLICDLEGEGAIPCDEAGTRGVVRLVKALVESKRVESTVRIYRILKESGWGEIGCDVDEYLVRVLKVGFKRLGKLSLADEVERDFGGNFGRLKV